MLNKFKTKIGEFNMKNKFIIEVDVLENGEMKSKVVRDLNEVSDGFHTFGELYYHRMMLFSVICNSNKDVAWKSWQHHDGFMYKDFFIVGIETPLGQYSYHYHKVFWDMFNVKELEFAEPWDGHKPEDITRLLSLIDR